MKKIFGFILILMIASCSSHNKATVKDNDMQPMPEPAEQILKGGGTNYALPTVIIYKTVKPYADNVPVILDATRTKITSYPAPSDIYTNGELAKPTPLKDGYWLDNRGININVAFTSYTYEEYSKMSSTPSIDELMNHIIDRNPLVELYYIKESRKDVEYYNNVIDTDFKSWTKLHTQAPPKIYLKK